MDFWIQNLLNGISFGVILFLIAAGATIIAGLMRIIHLAHGAIYMVGAYVGLTAAVYSGNFVIGILAGTIAAALLGLVLQKGFFAHLHWQLLEQVLVSVGVVYILVNVVQWVWGPEGQMGYVPSILSSSVGMFGFRFPAYRLGVILIGLIVAVGLWFIERKTRIGAIIRAGMDNAEMTTGLGINLPLVFTGVFVFGAFIAGFAGFIGSPILGAYPEVAWDTLLLALIVVVVGGQGSLVGALVASMLIGIFDAFGKALFPDIAPFTIYLVMVIVLAVKPHGLMGRAN